MSLANVRETLKYKSFDPIPDSLCSITVHYGSHFEFGHLWRYQLVVCFRRFASGGNKGILGEPNLGLRGRCQAIFLSLYSPCTFYMRQSYMFQGA